MLVQSLHRVALYTGAAGGDGRKRNDDEGVETERRRRRDWRKRQKSDLLLFFMCWEPHRAAGWKLAWQQEQRDPPRLKRRLPGIQKSRLKLKTNLLSGSVSCSGEGRQRGV